MTAGAPTRNPNREMDMTPITTRSRARRAVAAASALAIGLLGAAGLAGTASADPLTGADIGHIDPARAGLAATSVVVHKYEKNDANGEAGNTGAQTGVDLGAAPGGALPIAGANFTITPVLDGGAELDLLSNAGWKRASEAQAAFVASTATFTDADFTLGTAGTPVATNASGIATFGSLDFGLYLVREVSPLPAGVISPAQPFLVTVPFPTGATHPTNPNEWLYTVHAYPKNAVTGVEKVVNSGDAAFFTAGDHVSWTISADVPVLAAGDALTVFSVTDTVVDTELDFVAPGDEPAGITAWSVTATDDAGDPVALTAVTDYAITSPITAATTSVTVSFTAAGLAKLQASAQGGEVVVTVPTRIVAVPADGIVDNTAGVTVNNAQLTDPASTNFGQLRVFKYADTDVADVPARTPLAGATFELYVDVDQDGVVDAGEIASANRVEVAGETDWTSGASGLLDIPALKVGRYFLVETAAPVGYQLDTTPHAVTVTAGTSSTAPAVNYVQIANSQVPAWLLPFTGGNGVVTFTVAGASLMALALGFALLAARRRKQAEQH